MVLKQLGPHLKLCSFDSLIIFLALYTYACTIQQSPETTTDFIIPCLPVSEKLTKKGKCTPLELNVTGIKEISL